MSQVSLRIQKLKCSNISGAKKHNQREYKPDNAHTEKSVLNEVFIGSGNIDDLVFSRIRDQKARVIESGKNASTIAIEMVLSASPEYFRDDPLDAGVFDQKKMEAWRDANLVFLKNKYGDNLVRVDLHLDESTPHMHAIITPLVQKERKIRGKDKYRTVNVLDAKNMFNRKALVELQSEAAQAVSHLNIERGLRCSKAKHTSIKQFYSKVSEPKPSPLVEHLDYDLAKVFSGPSKKELISHANWCVNRYEEELQIRDQRIRALEEQLKTKQGQLGFYSKYQDDSSGKSFMHKVENEVARIYNGFHSVVMELKERNQNLLERYEILEIEKERALLDLSHALGMSPVDSQQPDIDIRDVYPELNPIDANQEIEKAKDVVKPGLDPDYLSGLFKM
jgi:hypothetical protein